MNTEVIKASAYLEYCGSRHFVGRVWCFTSFNDTMHQSVYMEFCKISMFSYKKVIGIFVIVEILIRYLIYVKKVKSS